MREDKKWDIRFSFYQQLENENIPFSDMQKSPTFKDLTRKEKVLVLKITPIRFDYMGANRLRVKCHTNFY
ncbi:MAG: hypothetical protein ACK5NC_03660 [Vibrio sp.]